MAWAVARRRVVCPATSRSHRPRSSSPRRSRVLVSSPHTAPRIMRVMETLKSVNPVTVWRAGVGPKRVLIAWLAP